MIKRYQLIDDTTGEVIEESDQAFTAAMTDDGYRFPSHKAGARLFADVKFPDCMIDSDIGKMTRLSKLMIAKTNMLGYRDGRNVFAYTIVDLTELVGLSENRCHQFINRMVNLRIMQRIVTTSGPQYYINPAYFMASGQRLSLDLFLLFRAELTPILPEWVIDDFLRQVRTKQNA